jgi:hypothetical protein
MHYEVSQNLVPPRPKKGHAHRRGDASIGKHRLRKSLVDMRECDCGRRKEAQRRRNSYAQ